MQIQNRSAKEYFLIIEIIKSFIKFAKKFKILNIYLT